MNKFFILVFFSISLFSREIPLAHVKKREFSTFIDINSEIVQLSNSKQSITSLISGNIEKYYVEQATEVKSGQKVALIDSFELSKITSEYVALKRQLKAVEDNYNSTKNLFEKGMASKKDLNEQSIEKNRIYSNYKSIGAKLKTLDIDTTKLKSGTSSYVLRAHIDGKVTDILQPQHSSVSEHTPLLNILNDDGYYLKSYLPLKYSQKVRLGQKITFKYGTDIIETQISKILPELDSKTQRIVVLSSIPKSKNRFFVGSYVASSVYFNENKSYKSIKKSALSFFNNEWVVFVPKEDFEKHNEHEGHGHEEEIDLHAGHEHDEHEGHSHEEEKDEHADEEALYEPRVVKIITQDKEYVAIEGLELEEEYVSAKSYYVKSMLLKSSLGGHGH